MPADLFLYHSNDMHNRTGVLDLFHRLRRREPSLLLDAGDAIRGSNTVFHLTEPILARMQRTGYQAMTMGNRELHYIRWIQRMRAEERGFPILAANLVDLRHNGPNPLWRPWVKLDIAGARVGVFGATPMQYRTGSSWERWTGLRFLRPEACLPAIVEELRPACDVLIFLSHLGLAEDRRVAPTLEGVDLIIGGHSHDLLTHPEKAGGAWLVHAGCHGKYLGEAHLGLQPFRLVDYRLQDTTLLNGTE